MHHLSQLSPKGTECISASLVGTFGILEVTSLARLPVINRRKVGTTSNHHAPYALGYTRVTMAGTMSRQLARVSKSLKASLSSDCSLQLDCMKSESLVIADQQSCGEYVPGPCTHRPSHHGSRSRLKPVAYPQGGSRLWRDW